ncbi:MAG: hypothetical protein MSG64_14535 [Pyrinomonadaceae bacterium MAG19_C2-C3]|nr:hypothetical protein [Pyrinomonadaceae bacterium MAG19_C2-C3]
MNKKINPERVRGKYHGMEVTVVGAVDKPIEQTDIIPRLLRERRERLERNPPKLIVEIDADLLPHFENAEAVNNALRHIVDAATNR